MMLEKAIEALRTGRPVLIYDGDYREAEADFVVRADAVTPGLVRWLRQNAGGLLCFVTTEEIGRALGLEFLSEYYRRLGLSVLPKYGDEPAFMGYVNHKKTKTGVRDSDKALTIRELARVVEMALSDPDRAKKTFVDEFYGPGHVPVLGARLGRRWGHTELSAILAKAAGLPPALAIIEVLGPSVDAMPYEEVEELAKSLGVPLLRGEELKALA
ncbi:3,4-dihydroxy-2-butanone 4-phosphate synthase [Thermoproteus uzoniensis 768-20]|uniref:3,4-dihydroxy-2-butanone 4-phosphate synthase n=1 Tax=Thermoproteus uzoniensis (strain 768-20) TaxID=999630 RepID=F2L4J1_THEU7|nr:3,4-dihydroxy-2-butanone-4-phosphate synthase [Thermoproteus uzoniensis]AEA12169.1 3,4-dihydroxy-2-butanone 4-phosphate synthase [Thermoproteus uzoniensis 768-20]